MPGDTQVLFRLLLLRSMNEFAPETINGIPQVCRYERFVHLHCSSVLRGFHALRATRRLLCTHYLRGTTTNRATKSENITHNSQCIISLGLEIYQNKLCWVGKHVQVVVATILYFVPYYQVLRHETDELHNPRPTQPKKNK